MNDYGAKAQAIQSARAHVGSYGSTDNQTGDASQLCPSSEIEQVTQRIHGFADGFENIGSMLCAHADRLHGARPEDAATGGPVPCRMGQIGALHDALDRLDRVQSYVAEQAGRNSNIA